MIMIIIVI